MMSVMRAWLAGIAAFGAVIVLGAGAVVVWLDSGMAYEIAPRVPGTDRPAGAGGQDAPEKLEGKLTTFDVKAPEVRGGWPCFRGKTREGISDDLTPLARTWPKDGPPVKWSLQVGEGHAGAAILDGRVYLHDYDAGQRQEVIRCLGLDSGKDIWRYAYRLRIKRNHGSTRTVPAVTDKYLLALGAKCHVTCLEPKTGKLLWAKDLVAEYGTTIPQWYAAQCPLIDDGNAILAPCGQVVESQDSAGKTVYRGKSVLMTAIRCDTGKVTWEVPNPDGWKMTHSSIAVMEMEDYTRMYVYCGSRGVVGVSAKDGKVLWKTTDWWIGMATVPTPLPVGQGKLFFTGGYGAGSMMLQVVKEGDHYAAKVLLRLPPAGFASEQQTPVFFKNHIFGTRVDEQFVCLSPGGQVVWTSGQDNKFGKEGGPYLLADDMLLVMDGEGVLRMLKATPQSYQEVARAKVLPGPHSWGPMALAGGKLICRDLHNMVCLDLGKKD